MNNNSKILAALLVGAAVGGAVAWFLTADNKEEILEEIKEKAGKVKDDFSETVERGKQIVEDIKGRAEGFFTKQ